MSPWMHGWQGLTLGYAAVESPLLATLIARGSGLRRLMVSPLLAVPLTAAGALTCALLGPVARSVGLQSDSVLGIAAGLAVYATIGYGVGTGLARAARAGVAHQRGAVVHETQPDKRAIRPASLHDARRSSHFRVGERSVTLAGLGIAPPDETKHFKLIGTTGTGKSTAIRELLDGALKRGDRAIIADPDGGYLGRFRNVRRGDVILNPFEAGSLKWHLFGEIDTPYDVEQLARSLLPDQGGSADRSWIGYARTFFSAVTRQAHEAGVTDVSELYRLLIVADTRELRSFLAGTPAQPFLDEHNARMFDSIRSVASSAVASLEHVAQQNAPLLSVREWVRERRPGVLFIPYRAGQIAALRSSISAWMRLALFEAMNQPEDDQRLWFIVDELDALGAIDGLKDALARLRKFGGRCVLGFQSIAQVSSTYGAGDAQTIVENCGNTLILRCSASEHGGTASFASRLIGQREILRTGVSRSRRPAELFPSITLSEHVAIEPAVMDSQIEQLPDLSGYLKFASVPHWQRVTLQAAEPADSARARAEARSVWDHWRSSKPARERGRIADTRPERIRAGASPGRDYE